MFACTARCFRVFVRCLSAGPACLPWLTITLGSVAHRRRRAFPNAAIGVIDMQQHPAGVDRLAGVSTPTAGLSGPTTSRRREEEQALRDEQRGLPSSPNQAPTPEMQEKARAFREKVAAFEKSVAERRRNLERALSIALSEVQQMITVVADEVAAERGINLVLYRSQVPLFDPRMEMTEDVLKPSERPAADVEFPDPAEVPAGAGSPAVDQAVGLPGRAGRELSVGTRALVLLRRCLPGWRQIGR